MSEVSATNGAQLVIQAPWGFRAEPEEPGATPLAVGIAGDSILWVCPPEAVGSEQAPVAEGAVIETYPNGFLMPGFHDAHLHYFHSALYHSPLAEQYLGRSEADCVARLAPLAARRPEGAWLLTQGWREYRWDPPVLPSKASLDAVYPHQPVAMYSGDAHTLWLNSCALEQLGITADSVAPEGGSYDVNEQGELTGIVREAAAMALMPRIVAQFSREELLEAYRDFATLLNQQGVTAVCDVSLMALPGLDFVRDDLFAELERQGGLTVRVSLFPTLLGETTRLDDLQATLTSPLLQARGYKQFFDGVSSQHTAWLHEPYSNANFEGDCGRPTIDPEAMTQLVLKAAEEGHGVRVHAIGDEAIHGILDAYEQGRAVYGSLEQGAHPTEQLTIEHLENFQPADLDRLAPLDVVASVQPRHITLDPGGPERDLGEARVPYMWPFATLLAKGVILAFGTDSPVTQTDPLPAVYTAVTRKDADTHQPEGGWLPAEAISLADALRAYTAGSAQAAGRAQDLGRLRPGMKADVVVFDRNLFALDPEELQEARVAATYVGGRKVYEAHNAAAD